MPLKSLKIKNFKSIKNLQLECKRVNLFIGEPNTGKSNILEAIGLLSHVFHGGITQFVRFEIMTDLFYDHILDDFITINFDDGTLQIKFKDGQFLGEYIRIGKGGFSIFGYDFKGTGSKSRYPDFEVFKFYRFIRQEKFSNQESGFLHPPHGNNLLAVLMSQKKLKKIVREIFGNFNYRIIFRPEEGKMEHAKEIEDVFVALPYSLASETLQRLVFYLAAIHSNQKSILTFEEPESHAFPYYTKYLAEKIATDINNNQYFIATHNPYFLTSILEKSPKEDVAIFVTSFEDYQTKVKELSEKHKNKILVDMGYDFFFNIEKFLK